MIYVRLMGGLGNQMFQYAFASALSKRVGIDFFLDTFFLENSKPAIGFTKRDFELDVFNIKGEISRIDVSSRFRKFFLKRIRNFDFYTEREFSYNYDVSRIKPLKKTLYTGYFQSEKYFSDFAERLREELVFLKYPNIETQKMEDKIANDERAVSLHFRRGDYVTNKKVQSFHGVCDLDYYRRAVDLVHEIDPHLYIFSDDLKWVRENFNTGFKTTYVDINNKPQDSYGDMLLMSKARHNIIANSSFSWWGAWLNNNPDKIVVAPCSWFADSSLNTSDLIPTDWIKV